MKESGSQYSIVIPQVYDEDEEEPRKERNEEEIIVSGNSETKWSLAHTEYCNYQKNFFRKLSLHFLVRAVSYTHLDVYKRQVINRYTRVS